MLERLYISSPKVAVKCCWREEHLGFLCLACCHRDLALDKVQENRYVDDDRMFISHQQLLVTPQIKILDTDHVMSV